MKELSLKVLSGYDRRILKGNKPTENDEEAKKYMTRNLLNKMLGSEVVVELEDGTSVTYTAEELVIASAIGDAIAKGSLDKLQTLSKIRGEMEVADTSVNVSLVDKDLQERAIK